MSIWPEEPLLRRAPQLVRSASVQLHRVRTLASLRELATVKQRLKTWEEDEIAREREFTAEIERIKNSKREPSEERLQRLFQEIDEESDSFWRRKTKFPLAIRNVESTTARQRRRQSGKAADSVRPVRQTDLEFTRPRTAPAVMGVPQLSIPPRARKRSLSRKCSLEDMVIQGTVVSQGHYFVVAWLD
mmetsp:Transcript_517/g.869  ORF Transcript_517/g.869 Transcript_517/m.869 type:complete len:188 (+) Transcript_517:97-660(+)|eukprot:CAMPEP_0184645354 /NCGR_PEP_ID=MMETSP0308-20130426/1831_1 /TAXON_ID=38269 /ORGANISM="Gloeochaete witrockiana, Strain SAG 46.84" /LENGTH=187 /DNA_ID=CAMNT_0027074279 /DNA_START=88 /DNA_END=651 /DNA_ORIENTATION=+